MSLIFSDSALGAESGQTTFQNALLGLLMGTLHTDGLRLFIRLPTNAPCVYNFRELKEKHSASCSIAHIRFSPFARAAPSDDLGPEHGRPRGGVRPCSAS